jgi:hypothetical protein
MMIKIRETSLRHPLRLKGVLLAHLGYRALVARRSRLQHPLCLLPRALSTSLTDEAGRLRQLWAIVSLLRYRRGMRTEVLMCACRQSPCRASAPRLALGHVLASQVLMTRDMELRLLLAKLRPRTSKR